MSAREMTRTRPSGPSRSAGRFALWALVIALVVLLGILLLPVGIKYGLQWWLARHSTGTAVVEDVDFDIFSGNLGIRNIQVTRGNEALLKVGEIRTHLNLRPLWRRELQLAEVILEDATVDVRQTEQGRVVVGGIAPEGLGGSWTLLVHDLGLNRTRVRFALPRFSGEMEIGGLRGSEIERTAADGGEALELAAKLQGRGIKVQGRIRPLGAEGGPTNIIDVSGSLNADGQVRARSQRSGQQWDLQTDGTLAVDGLNAAAGSAVIEEQLLSWKGTLNSRWRTDVPDVFLRAQGRLTGLQTGLLLPEKGLHFVQDNPLWEGWLEVGRSVEAGPYLRMNADAATGKVRVESADGQRILAAVEAVQFWGITAEDLQRFKIGEVWLGPVRTAQEETVGTGEGKQKSESFSLSGITAQGVQVVEGQRLDIGSLQLRNTQARIARDEQDRWHWPAGPALAFMGNLARIAASQGIAWRIGALETAGDASVQFEDRAVRPAYLATLEPFRLLIENLDSAAPQQFSRLYLRTALTQGGAIDLTASFRPLATDLGLDLIGNVTNLALAPLSPYSARCVGYGFSKGQLSGELIVYLNKDQLWASARMTLEGLKPWLYSPEAAQHATAALGMPLDEAITSLEDPNGRIALRLNVTGDVGSPGFDPCTAVRDALVAFLNQQLKQSAAHRSTGTEVNSAEPAQPEPKEQTETQ